MIRGKAPEKNREKLRDKEWGREKGG